MSEVVEEKEWDKLKANAKSPKFSVSGFFKGLSKGQKRLGLLILVIAVAFGWKSVGNQGQAEEGPRIEYGEAYRAAKELRTTVQGMRTNEGCQKVSQYVSSQFTTQATYDEYVQKCRQTGAGAVEASAMLAETAGVKEDAGVAQKYLTFSQALGEASEATAAREEQLYLYTVWHNFILASATVEGWDKSDAELWSVAAILYDSGNEALVQYSNRWFTLRQAAAEAYRAYFAAPYDAEDKAVLRDMMSATQNEYTQATAAEQPNITEIAPLAVADGVGVAAKFEEMFNLIRQGYEKNYDYTSGDCRELPNSVICD